MKVKKAIKRIAALGVGATMMGATLMGAMAADLSEYPDMFITDGQFDGLLVVGKNADAVDTIGVTNIALGLQKAAVTKTMVCGAATASRTTVTGEKVQIEKTGDSLNIGDDLEDVQTVALDDGDLPSILADGEYDESEGENDNDVTYKQEIELMDGSGLVVYDQDDRDAPDAGVYVQLPKGEDVYTYTLEFDDAVEYDIDEPEEDLESTNLEIQGQSYTITQAEFNGDDEIDTLTMMVGDSVLWISQDETVTKEINGVEHTITMVDVSENEDKCGFLVDGSNVWIDIDETRTTNGVTLGVTEATAVHNKDYDADICKVFIGAEELILQTGQEVEIGGDEVAGSLVTIESDGDEGEWTALTITYDPDDDVYLASGDEWVDPVFGNFKFIMGGEVSVNEEITLTASSNKATLTFINYDDEEVEIPFIMDDAGDFFLGEDEDQVANPDDGFYLEGDTCDGSGDVTECVGAKFLVAVDNVAHVIELASISDPDATDPEIDFDDLTYGTSTDNNDYENGENDFDLGSGVGEITLIIDTAAGTIEFDTLGDGDDILTQNEGIIVLDDVNRDGFTFTENDDEGVEDTFTFNMDGDDDEEAIEIDAPTGFDNDAVDFSDSDDDNQMYYSVWGSIVKYDSEDKDDLTLWHPEEQLYVDFFCR
jgi:hypothetical protein